MKQVDVNTKLINKVAVAKLFRGINNISNLII